MDLAALTGLPESALLLHLVDLVLLVSLAELLWLGVRRPAGFKHLLPNVMAGLSLTLALRLGLGGAGLLWVAPCLMAAGLSHLLDLRVRRCMMSSSAHSPVNGHERFTP